MKSRNTKHTALQ